MLADLRHGTRILRRRPAVTLVASCSLAVGIGVGTGLFSVAEALFIRPLAVAEPDQLVEVFTLSPSGFVEPLSWPEARDVATQALSLASVAAFDRRGITLRRGDELEPLLLSAVSDDYFATLGVRATLGRVVGPGIDRGLPRPADGPLHLGLPVPVVPEPLGHSLNEALLLQPDGGAVASFGPAGITTPRQQETLARGVYARFLNEGRALGDAVRESKAEAMTADPSTRAAVDGWNLLGDPAQRLPASP